jgi:hypothetical protein
MDLETFLTAVYCLIDDTLRSLLHGARLRARGPAPTLADSEVLTMEVVGEFLGFDTDVGIHAYFRRHWTALFPAMRQVHRATFHRQAARLWAVKHALWQQLVRQVHADAALSLIDSVPIPVCRFGRARRCRLFRGTAAFGYDETARQTYYGFRAHVRVVWPGVITHVELTAANVADVVAAPYVLADATGVALGDRNYWSPELSRALAREGLALLAPFRTASRETLKWPRWLTNTRRRIETVFGQLVGRYHAKRVWARDRWHLTARWLRKLLSHTIALLFCQQRGLEPLPFWRLLQA